MAVYVRGDVHGYLEELTDFIDRFQLDENDAIIVLGDLGLYWDKRGLYAKKFIEFYEANYRTHILWIDGNHENFDLIDKLEYEDSSTFKKCSDHIHYIPRGTIFYVKTEDGFKSCLACGGADSIDKFKRVKHLTWWEQEQITDNDIETAINNAKDMPIDYVFTHACPLSVFHQYAPWLITLTGINQSKVDHTSEEKLEKLMNSIDFGQWFFGHYHLDKRLDEKFTCLFQDFIEL